jgi:hypothetical protein
MLKTPEKLLTLGEFLKLPETELASEFDLVCKPQCYIAVIIIHPS